MWCVWWKREVRVGFWWRNPKNRDQLKGLGLDGRIILKWNLKKYDGMAWTGLIWLRIGIGGRVLGLC